MWVADLRRGLPDCGETRAAHPERGHTFSPTIVLQGKGISVGSLWKGWDLHGITKMFPESECSLAWLPYQQQNNCIATSPGHFLAHYSLSRENAPTAPCLLCQFGQTGVESACQVEEQHMLAFPSTCCSPRGLPEGCLLASEELSPPPLPLAGATRNNN